MIKGNKGEWSELYVLVTLLAEGKLYQSDFNLEKDLNNVYEISKAYKSESNYYLEFDREERITLSKVQDDKREVITTFSQEDMQNVAKILYNGINEGTGSFAIVEADRFLSTSLIKKLKADPSVKADIKLRIYDHRLAKETDLGFSIKSLIGGDSTLFNTGPGNNFIYSVENKLKESIKAFNCRTYQAPGGVSKIAYRLRELVKLGSEIKFQSIQSNQLWKNLRLVDGDLPEILAWALFYRWVYREPSLKKIAELLENIDPLNLYDNIVNEQKFYEYKIKRFLTEAAMGMTSEKPWLGEYDSFGGVIIAKNDGDIVCFHIYDFNLFRNYLLDNTVFEQPSTGEDPNNPGNIRALGKKYYYGWLYQEDSDLRFKINLQIRFK
jgi:hypothetical protein